MSISIYCPWCHKHANLASIGLIASMHGDYSTTELNRLIYYQTEKGNWSIGSCPSCKNCVLISFDNKWKIKHILPSPMPSPTDERIPEDIKKDIEEAKLCLSVSAFRACASMCRRAIQQACIKEGATKNKDLEKQIDELKEKGILTEQIKKWAHSCRYVGNDASHPENPEVTETDAKDVLNLAEQLMNILYVMPAISEEINKNHEKKKNE